MSEDLLQGQRRTAGAALTRAREQAGLTKVRLAARAGIHPRTVRRIELGEVADLASYTSLGYVLGWPPDWFLRSTDAPEGTDADIQAVASAERSVEYAAATGWYGPEGIALVRELHEFARQDPGASGALEVMSVGWRSDLRRRALGAPRR